MGQLFSDVVAVTRFAELDSLRAGQRAWLADRDQACGGQESCLGVLLRSRIRALKEILAGRAQVTTAPSNPTQPASNSASASSVAVVPAQQETGGEVQGADGTQWGSSPRCAAYKSKHDELRLQVDAGNMLAAQDLTHLDVTAELGGCKWNGASIRGAQSRMKECEAQASAKVG